MKKKLIVVAAISGFLVIQSCTPTTPGAPTPVDFILANVQGTWNVNKINDYDFSDNETGSNTLPAGYYDWSFGMDDSLRTVVSGSTTSAAHFQLGNHLGKNIIITSLGGMVDTVEVTLITASTMELNNKIDVTATTAAGEYEKYWLSK